MSMSPISAPSVAFARPRVGSLGYASWPTNAATGCTGHMSVMAVNHGDTTGTTESKRLTPGHLMGALT
jgi:hypothetical protein